ncbi:TPA: fimbrial protein [Escherichia coli]
MRLRIILSIMLLVSTIIQAAQPKSPNFQPLKVTLPEDWKEEQIWWDGQANFKGQVIESTCTLAMVDAYQEIDLGTTPIRDIQSSSVGPERKFRLRLRNCDLVETDSDFHTINHVRITFDGIPGETPDKFWLTGLAEGINLQIMDNNGYPARVGKTMPPLLLKGSEEELNYILRIVRNGSSLKAGDYYAVIRFKMDYE